jgi:hypothetical protein
MQEGGRQRVRHGDLGVPPLAGDRGQRGPGLLAQPRPTVHVRRPHARERHLRAVRAASQQVGRAAHVPGLDEHARLDDPHEVGDGRLHGEQVLA